MITCERDYPRNVWVFKMGTLRFTLPCSFGEFDIQRCFDALMSRMEFEDGQRQCLANEANTCLFFNLGLAVQRALASRGRVRQLMNRSILA